MFLVCFFWEMFSVYWLVFYFNFDARKIFAVQKIVRFSFLSKKTRRCKRNSWAEGSVKEFFEILWHGKSSHLLTQMTTTENDQQNTQISQQKNHKQHCQQLRKVPTILERPRRATNK